ncbi:MAG TPA: polyribonucleotide nucleotidyltransferase [Ignavibacteria bacterium]|nr:polyribonucleotide nucleotidyltransferase [Ignavibacteria bacterium]
MIHRKSIEIGGKTLTLETGRLAKQANGAVLVTLGDNVVLCTATAKNEAVEGQDFFPLTVDYREKTASYGKIPGGFFKREGKPPDKEVLNSRLIDRPLRPMFQEGYLSETQIVATLYSSEGNFDSGVLGCIGSSAALLISNIPFNIPVSEVSITKVDGKMIVFPSTDESEQGDFEIIVAGTKDSILMVEGEAKEISEEEFLEAIKFAHQYIAMLCQFQEDFAKEVAIPKREVKLPDVDQQLIEEIKSIIIDELRAAQRSILKKEDRGSKAKEIHEKALAEIIARYPAYGEDPTAEKKIKSIINDIEYYEMREMILNEGKRLDGRNTTDIRNITSEIGVLPRTHGSALFTRGETQSLTSATLGTKRDEQIIDGYKVDVTKRFMLHYNFPSFSTGEVGGRPGPGRREIGHGNLAERALKNMSPDEYEFPYTIRIVSDILESNGSSSMATVCAGSLALMDAGVPIKKPVAGIAMGLIKEGERTAILSDILGDEDHLGDMDFKVAGTTDGITAIQMDIKIQGISFDIMERALAQAKDGRLHILGKMNETISKAKENISTYAPHLYTMNVPTEMIGAVIGPGGKNIRLIISESGAEIDIDDAGKVTIAATNSESAEKAKDMISKITEQPEIGKTYDGVVKGIRDFGAFVEFLPGKEGLLHISEIEHRRLKDVKEVLKMGQAVKVKLIGKDDQGKLKLSRKALLPKPEGYVEREERPRTDRRDRPERKERIEKPAEDKKEE